MNRHYDRYMLRDMMQELDSIFRPYIGLGCGGWVFDSIKYKHPYINVSSVYSVDGKIIGIRALVFGYKNPVLFGSDNIGTGGVEHRPGCNQVHFGGLGFGASGSRDMNEAADREYEAIQKDLERKRGFSRTEPASFFCGSDWFWMACCVVAIFVWIGG